MVIENGAAVELGLCDGRGTREVQAGGFGVVIH